MSRILILILIFLFSSCASQKATTERRGFMIPKKSEMPINKKHNYKEKKRKYY